MQSESVSTSSSGPLVPIPRAEEPTLVRVPLSSSSRTNAPKKKPDWAQELLSTLCKGLVQAHEGRTLFSTKEMVEFFVSSKACSNAAKAGQLLDRMVESGFLSRISSVEVFGTAALIHSSFSDLVTHLDDGDNADRHWLVHPVFDKSLEKVVRKEEVDILERRSEFENSDLRQWTEQGVDIFLEQAAIKLANDKSGLGCKLELSKFHRLTPLLPVASLKKWLGFAPKLPADVPVLNAFGVTVLGDNCMIDMVRSKK